MKKILMIVFVILTMLCSTVLSFAATDYGVTIVSPASKSEISANSLLISIKLTQPRTINVSVYEEKRQSGGTLVPILASDWSKADKEIKSKSVVYMEKEAFTCTNNLSFYTKQLNDVAPGTYRVQAEVIGPDKKVAYSTYSLVVVTDQATGKIFETSQSGTMQFLQNLLKSIFGDD